MTLSAFISQHAPLLASRLAGFKDDFLKVFPKIERYQCKTIKELGLEHLKQGIPDAAPLVLFLPADNGPGVLAKALWEGREGDQANQWTALGNLQAEVLRAVGNSGQEVNLGAKNVRIVPAEREASPFDVRSSEIISCEFNTVFDLFLQTVFDPRRGASVQRPPHHGRAVQVRQDAAGFLHTTTHFHPRIPLRSGRPQGAAAADAQPTSCRVAGAVNCFL